MTLWRRRGRDASNFACLGFVAKINSFKTWTDLTEMQKSSKKKNPNTLPWMWHVALG